MKRLWLSVLFLMLMSSVCWATIVEIGGGTLNTVSNVTEVSSGDLDVSGFSYVVKTKTHTATTGKETDRVVWTPDSGEKITLLGAKFSSDTATSLLIETGTTTAVIPTSECTASGQVVVGNGVPIWQGEVDGNLTYTTGTVGSHSILLWGYEN